MNLVPLLIILLPSGTNAWAGHISQLAFSIDGRLLASASDDKTVGVWETSTGQKKTLFRCTKSVGCAAFSPDKRLLISRDDGDNVVIWDIERSTAIRSWTIVDQTPEPNGVHDSRHKECQVLFSSDSRLAFAAGYGGVFAGDVTTGQRALQYLGHGMGQNRSVRALALPLGGDTALSSSDGEVQLWSLFNGETLSRAALDAGPFAFSQTRGLIFSLPTPSYMDPGTPDKPTGIYIWDLKTLPQKQSGPWPETLKSELWRMDLKGPTRRISLSLDGRRLLTLGSRLQIWDTAQRKLLADLGELESRATATLSPDGAIVAIGRNNGTIETRSVTGDLLAQWKGHSGTPAPFTGADFFEEINNNPAVKEHLKQRLNKLDLCMKQAGANHDQQAYYECWKEFDPPEPSK